MPVWLLFTYIEGETDMENIKSDGTFAGDEIDLIKLQFTDLFGRLKMVEMTKAQGQRAMREGCGVDRFAPCGLKRGIDLQANHLAGGCEPSNLAYLKPDLSTYRILPWESGREDMAGVFCDVVSRDGRPSPYCTRSMLKGLIAGAEGMGLQIHFNFQCEFYLFHTDEEGRPTTITHEAAGYYDAGTIDLAESVRREMMLSLSDAGMEVESAHHGTAPGQHSFCLPVRYGVEAADYLQTFKAAVKRIAKRHGLHATFIPKPVTNGDGCGLKVGITIHDIGGKYDKEAIQYFRNGILMHLSEMMIFTNPLINSYKRLAALKNHLAKPVRPEAVRDEGMDMAVCCTDNMAGNCCLTALFPDPAANPYLALAVLVAAGLDGIERGREIAVCETNPPIPENLGEVLGKFDKNVFAKTVFGEEFCRVYREGKQEEWDRFCAYVTDWEVKEYLNRF